MGIATLDDVAAPASVRWLVRRGDGSHSSWSPDGKQIVFSWNGGAGVDQLYLIDVDRDAQPRLLAGQDPVRYNYDPDWSPNGQSVVFSSRVAE